jgi:hypothetical protein
MLRAKSIALIGVNRYKESRQTQLKLRELIQFYSGVYDSVNDFIDLTVRARRTQPNIKDQSGTFLIDVARSMESNLPWYDEVQYYLDHLRIIK